MAELGFFLKVAPNLFGQSLSVESVIYLSRCILHALCGEFLFPYVGRWR
jgi:hypothetical protein